MFGSAFLPDVHFRWRDVMTGALVTALLFTNRRMRPVGAESGAD
jgi:uncharacterized BrkB/YihY/UPF0761 family membrane protein